MLKDEDDDLVIVASDSESGTRKLINIHYDGAYVTNYKSGLYRTLHSGSSVTLTQGNS